LDHKILELLGFVIHHDTDIKAAHEVKQWLAIINNGVVGFQREILQLSSSMVSLFTCAPLMNWCLVTQQLWVVFVELSAVE
jgi:hypothetical protein